jgi:hypothetical protein
MNIKSGELFLYRKTDFFVVLEAVNGYLIHWDSVDYFLIGEY